MTTDVGACSANDSLTKAAEVMWSKDCGVVPVIDAENRVVGLITDRDICIAAATKNRRISEIKAAEMLGDDDKIISCPADDKAEDALKLMRKHKVKRIVVTGEDERLVGILSISDVLLAAGKNKKLKKKILSTLEEIFQPPPIILEELQLINYE